MFCKYEVYLAEWSRALIFSLLEVAGSNPGSRKNIFFSLAKISCFVRFINKVQMLFTVIELGEKKNKENFKRVPSGGSRTQDLLITGQEPIPVTPRRH